jgi:hypothetical protein
LISGELNRWLPGGEGPDLDVFLATTRKMPIGLRAMAAIYQLDVSITLDDLGWHFANWHHRPYCEETIWALRELEGLEQADIVEKAYQAVQPFWDKIGAFVADDFDNFVEWYSDSGLEELMLPLTMRMWDLQKIDDGLLGLCMPYARKYPSRLAPGATSSRSPPLRVVRGEEGE